MKRIYVAGAGPVGLVTATLLAEKENFVSLYEKSKTKRKIIASREAPFFEPGLDQRVNAAIGQGFLEVVANPSAAAAESDFSFVAVGTPTRRNGSVDLSAVLAACSDIARGLRNRSGYHLIVIRSTVFPGTTSRVIRETVERLSHKRAGSDFGLVVYPEFLRTGSAMYDMLHPDRIVLGQLDDSSGNMMEALVREVCGVNPPPVLRTNLMTAEMIKYASNAFLATKIAFINEIAGLCDQFENVDVQQVADGMGYDRRIGRAFLNAGLGFGGPCLPKDLKALVKGARRNGTRLRIAEATFASNELHPLRVVRLARELIGNLKGRKAAVLGLAYKPGTSDMKDAQSVKIVQALLDRKMRVSVYDPKAMRNAVAYFRKKVTYAKDIRDCLQDSDCCIIVTEWSEFKAIDSHLLMDAMNHTVVLDPRRVLDRSKLDPTITYRTIGLQRP